jgi:dTDP-4-amino-4,6-dideoxygalactose transaminase
MVEFNTIPHAEGSIPTIRTIRGWTMEFIDLAYQQQRIRDRIEANIQAVLKHGRYIMGQEVAQLEDRLAAYVGTRHAIGCASGTDALLLALMVYEVGPGDAIFTTPFTFMATAEVISLLGASPIFVDIDPATFNMDPAELQRAITAGKSFDERFYPLPGDIKPDRSAIVPKGVISVDLFGLPADYEGIRALAEKHELFVVEDAAQSFGAEYHGKKTCSLSDIGCTSFFPAKPLGCYGDGGMCFTDNDELADTIRSLRLHGQGDHKYENIRIGINGRLDTLQASILLAKFDIFPEEMELRQRVAQRYTRLLKSHPSLGLPNLPPGCKSAWAQYSILARDEDHRARLQRELREASIPTAIYYPKPLHLQPAFASLGHGAGDFPVSEDCARRIFSLPMHPYLTEKDQRKIAKVLADL